MATGTSTDLRKPPSARTGRPTQWTRRRSDGPCAATWQRPADRVEVRRIGARASGGAWRRGDVRRSRKQQRQSNLNTREIPRDGPTRHPIRLTPRQNGHAAAFRRRRRGRSAGSVSRNVIDYATVAADRSERALPDEGAETDAWQATDVRSSPATRNGRRPASFAASSARRSAPATAGPRRLRPPERGTGSY